MERVTEDRAPWPTIYYAERVARERRKSSHVSKIQGYFNNGFNTLPKSSLRIEQGGFGGSGGLKAKMIVSSSGGHPASGSAVKETDLN